MKVILFSLVTAVIVSGCAKTKSDSPGGGAKQAVRADGTCTTEVLADYAELGSQGSKFIQGASATLSQKLDANSGKQLENSAKAYIAQAQAFRNAYGNFTCLAESHGRVVTLNPSSFYAQIDKIDEQIAKDKAEVNSLAIGKDGACTPAFSKDLKAMRDQQKLLLRPFFKFLGEATRAAQSNTPIPKDDVGQAANAGEQALNELNTFRARHPGPFACTQVGELGDTEVVSSEKLDKAKEHLKSGLDKLETFMAAPAQ